MTSHCTHKTGRTHRTGKNIGKSPPAVSPVTGLPLHHLGTTSISVLYRLCTGLGTVSDRTRYRLCTGCSTNGISHDFVKYSAYLCPL